MNVSLHLAKISVREPNDVRWTALNRSADHLQCSSVNFSSRLAIRDYRQFQINLLRIGERRHANRYSFQKSGVINDLCKNVNVGFLDMWLLVTPFCKRLRIIYVWLLFQESKLKLFSKISQDSHRPNSNNSIYVHGRFLPFKIRFKCWLYLHMCSFEHSFKCEMTADPRLAIIIPPVLPVFQHPGVNWTESSVRPLLASPIKTSTIGCTQCYVTVILITHKKSQQMRGEKSLTLTHFQKSVSQ